MFSSFFDKASAELFVKTYIPRVQELLTEGIDCKQVLSIKECDYYDIKTEIWSMDGQDDVEMVSAYSKKGDYLGNPKTAKMLVEKFGIKEFEKTDPSHCVCSIGLNPDTETWYGWSHRAICGYSINDMIFEENFGDDKTPYKKHGTIKIENMQQAKQAASNFAASVS
jgi:hypothetical protein